MNDTEKWLLAGAYKLAGIEQTAKQISSEAGTKVQDYNELNETYGSGLRDKAIILEMLTLFKSNNQANDLYNEILKALSSDEWYSTQTLGYSLMAVGKYIQANSQDFNKNPDMSGYILMPDGKRIGFNTAKVNFNQIIPDGFEGKQISIHLDKKTNVKNVFINLEWNGVPINPNISDEKKNLSLDVDWLNEDGKTLDITNLKQGTSFYGHFRITNISGLSLSELALVQLIPSGWEIENTRLSNDSAPAWTTSYKLNMEKYTDIRDDRIMWFFDLPSNQKYYDFVVKLNAITEGKFILPPTIAETMYSKNYRAVKTGKNIFVKNK
ncbi:MAG: hypothetical protein H7263_07960 [Candidatus Sericytochromatia bacterium]|nr:hypothetical protein [Candidatus Sericytochromatia bacterium]